MKCTFISSKNEYKVVLRESLNFFAYSMTNVRRSIAAESKKKSWDGGPISHPNFLRSGRINSAARRSIYQITNLKVQALLKPTLITHMYNKR